MVLEVLRGKHNSLYYLAVKINNGNFELVQTKPKAKMRAWTLTGKDS
ncbi:unnamed protein product [marine sediment metagenome]|uniref:Uncharacterized protein n=1 Tax=marine sediment metagenome TaxID=412755 RepID=X1UZN4_9ZZZZ